MLTISIVIFSRHLVVENQVLDPLLFLPVCLLLTFHCNSKARIRRQVDSASLYCQYLYIGTGQNGQTHLLFVSFLRHQRKRHGIGRLRARSFRGSRFSAGFPSRSLHRQGNIEDSFAFEPARFNAIHHHLFEFTVEFGICFRITFLFLARDEDLLIVGLAVAVLFRSWTGCLHPLVHSKP